MAKTKYLVDCLQKIDLDISNAIKLMELTKNALEKIRSDDIFKLELEKSYDLCAQLNIDPEEDFQKHHRKRKIPKRLDENPETAATLTVAQHAAKETNSMLDRMIVDLSGKINNVKENFKPFLHILSPNPTFDAGFSKKNR